MTDLTLLVELPSYAHSFPLTVSSASTVLSIKRQIQLACPGAPKIEGQKLVWRGRFLRDEEVVGDIWKSEEEARIVHMAVHPTAWTAPPPEIPQPSSTSTPPPNPFSRARSPIPAAPPPPTQFPIPNPTPNLNPNANPSAAARARVMSYIVSRHIDAIGILASGKLPNRARVPRDSYLRDLAVQFVERNGYAWPAVLDEEFVIPAEGESMEPGLRYERVSSGSSQSYLVLRTMNTPNPLQIQALKILSYTFSILYLPTPPILIQTHIPPTVNQILQQAGLPQLRVQPTPPPQNQGPPVEPAPNAALPDLREFPLRPLLAPFVMLLVRTLLLVYFVSPARKPVFGLIIIAWVLYEVAWGNIREAVMDGWRRQRENPDVRAQAAARRPHQGPEQNAASNAARNARPTQMQIVVNELASMNLAEEEMTLNPDVGARPADEPSLAHKVATFMSLLLVTFHPAVWNRRRATLRAREGRVRIEAAARENDEGERRQELVAMHERRAGWVRAYVERVRAGDWVDE